jgi:membrane protein DedA with SNARE-associated domain
LTWRRPLEAQILHFIRSVYEAIGWPGVVLLMAIESACIPLPSEIIMPLAGWMLIADKGHGALFILAAGFYGAIGCVLGSCVAYFVGMWGGRPIIERYGKYLLISHRDLDTADRWFTEHGQLTVFVSRLLPVVRTFISFPAGVARMPLTRFIIYSFIGSFIWCIGLAYGGYLLGDHWESLRNVIRPFDIPILIAIVILIILYVYRHLKHVREDA